MRIPIQYALTYPERISTNGLGRLDLTQVKALSFLKPDPKRFPCLHFGYEAKRTGGTLPAVLNAANEVAVEKFLAEEISFTDIPKKIEKVMKKHTVVPKPDLEDILEADAWARNAFE
jgi:1-deoxy-D-xylulose-5-phosphate reductoisomerase